MKKQCSMQKKIESRRRKQADAVTITCYDKTETWDSREEALAFFKDAMRHSEGSERNRYTNIVWGLEDGLDVVDDHYWESKKSEAENPKDVIGDELPYGMMQYRDEDTKEWLPILVSLNYNDRGWYYEGLVPTDNFGNFGYDEFSRGFLKTCKFGTDKCDQELVNSMKKFFADASMDIDKMPTKEVTDLTAYIPKGMKYIGKD